MGFINAIMIWILALLVLASGVGLGLNMGSIPSAFSFVGLIFGTLLSNLVGKLFKPLLPHLGIENPVFIWMVAPIFGFCVVWIIFMSVGFEVSRRVNVFYKYKAGDLRLALWNRLNKRLGLCLGVLNSIAWLVLISFVIFNLSYWTTQIASTDRTGATHIINGLGEGLQSTGLDKAARAVGSVPDDYYKNADFAGFLAQNPQLSDRLGNYPAFLSLEQRDDVQQLVQDGTLVAAWKQGAPLSTVLDNAQVKTFFKNTDLRKTIWSSVQDNMDDITNYLFTGKSPKYDSEEIVGRWSFDVAPSLVNSMESHPKKHLSASDMKELKALWVQAFAQTMLIAGTDGQLFVKNVPDFTQKNQPPIDFKGQWSGQDTNYEITMTSPAPGTFSAVTDGVRLEFQSKDIPYVFQRIY
jgi:hypothetical protein